jgi:hypothetical protein
VVDTCKITEPIVDYDGTGDTIEPQGFATAETSAETEPDTDPGDEPDEEEQTRTGRPPSTGAGCASPRRSSRS